MRGWFGFWRRRASWPAFFVALAAQLAFSMAFLNGNDAPWTKAVEAANGAPPETLIGLPAVEPARSIAAIQMNGGVGDYVLWQAIDGPFALINVALLTLATGLLWRRLAPDSVIRHALWLPIIYLCAEFVENGAVAAFAVGTLAPHGAPALIQQLATTTKFIAAGGASAIGVASILAAAFIDFRRRAR